MKSLYLPSLCRLVNFIYRATFSVENGFYLLFIHQVKTKISDINFYKLLSSLVHLQPTHLNNINYVTHYSLSNYDILKDYTTNIIYIRYKTQMNTATVVKNSD